MEAVAGGGILYAVALIVGSLFGGGGIAALVVAVRKSGVERDKIVVDEALDIASARRAEIDHLVDRVDSLVQEADKLRADVAHLRIALDSIERERDHWKHRASVAEAALASHG